MRNLPARDIVLTIRRTFNKLPYDKICTRILSYIYKHIYKFSNDYRLVPEISESGRFHIHLQCHIEDMLEYNIFKNNYINRYGMLLNNFHIDEDNFLDRFIYIRKDSNDTLPKIYQTDIPEICKIITPATFPKLLCIIKNNRKKGNKKACRKIIDKTISTDQQSEIEKYFTIEKHTNTENTQLPAPPSLPTGGREGMRG